MNENISCFILISATNGELGRELQNICNALGANVIASEISIEPSKNDYFSVYMLHEKYLSVTC